MYGSAWLFRTQRSAGRPVPAVAKCNSWKQKIYDALQQVALHYAAPQHIFALPILGVSSL
jgi:hypothetical protein